MESVRLDTRMQCSVMAGHLVLHAGTVHGNRRRLVLVYDKRATTATQSSVA